MVVDVPPPADIQQPHSENHKTSHRRNLLLTVVIFLWQWSTWQNSVWALMGIDKKNRNSALHYRGRFLSGIPACAGHRQVIPGNLPVPGLETAALCATQSIFPYRTYSGLPVVLVRGGRGAVLGNPSLN